MQELTERDVAYDILYACKQGSEAYLTAVLESATPRCRDAFHRLHDDCVRDQWQVWQFLHQRSEYRTDEATTQEVDSVRRRMEQLAETHEPAMQGRGGDAGWSGRWEAGGGAQARRGAPRFEGSRYEPPRYEPTRFDPPRYDAARYDAARYDAAGSEVGRAGVDRYEAGRYAAPGRYDPERSEAGRYDTGPYGAGGWEPSPYDSPRYEPTRFETGRYQPSWYETTRRAGGWPDGGRFEGGHPEGSPDATRFDTTRFDAGGYDWNRPGPARFEPGRAAAPRYDGPRFDDGPRTPGAAADLRGWTADREGEGRARPESRWAGTWAQGGGGSVPGRGGWARPESARRGAPTTGPRG